MTEAARTAPVEARRPSALARAVTAAPDRIVLLLLWTSLVVALTVLAAAFTPWLVVPVLAVTVAATWRLGPDRVETSRASTLGAAGALAVAAAWLVVNLPYASRYLTVTRDPGFLTLEGIWLSQHADPDLPVGSAADVVRAVPGVMEWTGAYFLQDGYLHAQGAKLLPGLLALGGWVGGERAVMAGNLLLGAAALIALYALARRVVGPIWGLLPGVALAASVPLGVFSRAAYTEPLTVALAFGGLTLSWSAFRTGVWWRHALAGAMIGATALARIDGGAAAIGLVAGMGLVAGAPTTPDARRRLGVALAAGTTSALAMVGLGYLDLQLHSPGYLRDLGSQFAMLTAALLACVAFAVVLAIPPAWDPIRAWVHRHRATVGTVVGAAALGVAVLLVSRPAWMTSHRTPLGTAYASLVQGLQGREGLEIDPGRSYDELSVTWLSWYYGWPFVVLAFLGIALMARRAIQRYDAAQLVLVAVVAAPSALYLWQINITPDQVWAMRRFLPLTIPGFLVMATVTLAALWQARARWARAVALVGAAAVAVFPATTWGGLFRVAEQSGRWEEAEAVCATLQADQVVLVRPGGPPYLATLRTLCDVEVVQVEEVPTQDQLRAIREAWGGQAVDVVTFASDAVPWADAVPAPTHEGAVTTWSNALSYVPFDHVLSPNSVWVGTIEPDGTVTPLPTR